MKKVRTLPDRAEQATPMTHEYRAPRKRLDMSGYSAIRSTATQARGKAIRYASALKWSRSE